MKSVAASPESSDAHKAKTVLGLKWSLVNQILSLGTNFVIGILLARLLSPAQFGLIGMVTVIIGFAEVFNNFGTGSALVQKKQLTEEDCSSVFWLNILVSIAITGAVAFSSSYIAEFYSIPVLRNVTLALSFNFLLSGFGIVQRSLMLRRMDFKTQFKVDTSSVVISGGISILMAINGFGVWSLVLKSVLQNFISLLLLWYTSAWTPRFFFSRHSLKPIFNFSLPLLGQQSVNYWTRNVDNLLIGRFMSSEALGYYSRGYTLMLLPVRQVSGIISRVLFPSFSRIQDDPERIRTIYLKITRIIAFGTFPLMLGLSAVAEAFVLSVLGPKWAGMIPVLQILSILGATQSIGTLAGNIFLARNATRLLFKVGILTNCFMIGGIILGLKYGIVSVALFYTCSSLLMMVPTYYIMGKLINLSLTAIFDNLYPYLVLSLGMMGAIYLFDLLLIRWNAVVQIRLIANIFVGVVFYLSANLLLRPLAFKELLLMWRNKGY